MRWFGESRNFVAKPAKLSSIPRTYQWKKTDNSSRLSSVLHKYTVACTYLYNTDKEM